MNMTIAELEHHIKLNKSLIVSASRSILEHSDELRQMVTADDFNRSAARDWADGHVSELVTRLASLLQKDQTLRLALNIVKKGE